MEVTATLARTHCFGLLGRYRDVLQSDDRTVTLRQRTYSQSANNDCDEPEELCFPLRRVAFGIIPASATPPLPWLPLLLTD
ncbi:MAG: hypothetical protein Rhob2KO_44880 [Rhodopirellula baltica]